MKLIVHKFGGTSVGTPERILNVAGRIKKYTDDGYSVVVIVSAMGHTTDELIELAEKVNPNGSRREMDMLLSTGEQVSIAMLAMALQSIGVDAVSYTGSQIKMITDGNFANARIESISGDRMMKSLKEGKAVVVAGFQGIDKDENITTLGRGGSDTSAVAIASALGARDCEIFTDVDGVYTADPRTVPNTKKLKQISYDEMLELARLGAGVMHSRSIEFAKKYNVRVTVRSSLNFEEGTVIMPQEEMVEKHLITGVTSKTDQAKFTIRDIPDKPGIATELFGKLAEHRIYVDMIVQSTGKNNLATISFTVLRKDFAAAKEICETLKNEWKASEVGIKEDIAIVSAVGVGMVSSYGVAGRMFGVLAKEHINIEMISTSEIGISCVVDQKYAELAVKVIHKEFVENA